MKLLDDYSPGVAEIIREAQEDNTPRLISAEALQALGDALREHAVVSVAEKTDRATEEGARGQQKGSGKMNAITIESNLRETEGRYARSLQTGAANAQSREAALSRLLSLLEAGSDAEYTHEHADNALESGLELSQLARLRAAHASYALATNGKMRRLGRGAWVRERHA